MGRILTGTCSWTDKTLVDSGWYGGDAKDAASRLSHYAQHFPVVEVDSAYYSIPAEQVAQHWAERTPPDFIFDVKAFRALTHHPTPAKSLPSAIRRSLPASIEAKPKLYLKDLAAETVDELWSMYREALSPLHRAGKLGVVLFQFPAWFVANAENRTYLSCLKERLPDYDIAVEFRNPTWLQGAGAKRTLDALRTEQLAYTSVDEPQGTAASVPPIAAATSDIAVVRFHGRRAETWNERDVSVSDRYRYLYGEAELEEWVPKIKELAAETREVHALMNNCYSDYAVRNASQLAALLQDA